MSRRGAAGWARGRGLDVLVGLSNAVYWSGYAVMLAAQRVSVMLCRLR